ncbi:putative transcriptional regulator [Mycoplana sp. BE70]|uniref:hypothetical protein n=1 Tax=Mycoplana sp. BE70 TaxID=2817775 RepID=UPI002862D5E7|nr:hypothetical protein [Mycoplana sp. BE70]MDR6757820.1 putative transcriptional regulator [Mycoplana sp. BE70]
MFGQFFDKMTPQRFAALAPHMQTEALLLAAEVGLAVPVVAASISIPTLEAKRLMCQRHGYRTPEAASNWVDPDRSVDVRSNKMKILSMMLAEGGADGISLSLVEIAERAGIGSTNAPRAMRDLTHAGFIVCIKRGGPHHAAVYRVTEDGIEAVRKARGDR